MPETNRDMHSCSKLLIHHNWYQSFTTVAELTGQYLARYFAEVEYATDFPVQCTNNRIPPVVLYIHDTVDLLTLADRFSFRGGMRTVAWSDTCLDPSGYATLQALAGVTHVVASEHNFEQFSAYGVSCVLPRTFNQWAVDELGGRCGPTKDYYAVIGYCDDSDRKNFGQLAQVIESTGVHVKAVTNAEGPWERIEYGSLNEVEKYRFLSEARFLLWLSRGEGCGVPPIEAMSVGTPVIYSDVPAHNSFAVGLPVRATDTESFSSIQPNGNPILAQLTNLDVEDACRVVQYSRTVSDDEYARLQLQCLAKARRFRPDVAMEQLYRCAITALSEKRLGPFFGNKLT